MSRHFFDSRVRTITTHSLLEFGDLSKGRVLSTGAQQVTQGVESDATVATLIEEREGFFVVCRGLVVVVIVRVVRHVDNAFE